MIAFPLVVWAVGRALTAVAARTTPADGARLYLAGRVDRLRIDAFVAYPTCRGNVACEPAITVG